MSYTFPGRRHDRLDVYYERVHHRPERDYLPEDLRGLAMFGAVLTGLIAVFTVSLFVISIARAVSADYAYVRDICHARGMRHGSETEYHGKFSSTYNFCVDNEGRVFWLGQGD